jgi:type II secretory pathway component PulF
VILLGLTFALSGLLILIGWGMSRLRRGQVLRLLAVIQRRQMPLEATLQALTRARTASNEERVLDKVMVNISRGADLPLALSLSNVVTPQQAIALQVAERRGAGHTLFARLADQATEIERRLAVSEVTLVYPVVIGFALILQVSFLNVFIIPKFQMLFTEMNVTTAHFEDAFAAGHVLLYGMFIWGLLAITLQSQRFGRWFWLRLPGAGQHFRLAEQAAFARNLGLMLGSGATLEESIDAIAQANAAGPFRSEIFGVNDALKRGEPIVGAFESGAWRPEFMWAIGSIAQGVSPGPCLEQVAMVMEDKAKARLDRIHRVCMPIAMLVTGAGVALVGYSIFHGIAAVARGAL